jgi:hypothetical protein
MTTHAFLDRIPTDSDWHTTAASAFSAVESFRGRINTIKANTRLSSEGHLAEIREASKTGPLAYLSELRRQVVDERKSLANRRAHFELPKPADKDIVAALGMQEIRAWLRSLPNPGERLKHAASNPVIAGAVAHSPAALSGLDDAGLARAREFLVDHLFGDEIAALQAEVDVIDNVEQAINVAEGELRNAYEPERVPFTPKAE